MNADLNWQLRPFGKDQQPIPYVEIRDGLFARLGRTVYYQMIEQAVISDNTGDMLQCHFYSADRDFFIGEFPADG